jgi:hypothetical protein
MYHFEPALYVLHTARLLVQKKGLVDKGIVDKVKALGDSDSHLEEELEDLEQTVPQHEHLPTRLYRATGGVIHSDTDSAEEEDDVPEKSYSHRHEQVEDTPERPGSNQVSTNRSLQHYWQKLRLMHPFP